MLRLCLKDFYVNRAVPLVIVILFLFSFTIFFLLEQQVIHPTVLIFIITLILMYTDEKYKTTSFYCSLPVKRSTIVISRYFSLFLIISIGIFLALFCTFLLKKIWPIGFPPPPVWTHMDWFTILFPLMLIFSIIFPFYFRFGYSKGVILGLISSVVVGCLFIALFFLIVSIKSGSWGLAQYATGKEKSILAFIGSILMRVTSIFGKHNLVVFLSVFIIPIVIISIFLSIKLFKKREF